MVFIRRRQEGQSQRRECYDGNRCGSDVAVSLGMQVASSSCKRQGMHSSIEPGGETHPADTLILAL